jgi:hypothetical protein
MALPGSHQDLLQQIGRAMGLLHDDGDRLAPGVVPPAPLLSVRARQIERTIREPLAAA